MKEIFNYAIALVIMLAVGLCVISPADVYATGNDEMNQTTYRWVNPVFDSEAPNFKSSDSKVKENKSSQTASSGDYITTVKDAGELLRNKMTARKKTIEFNYKMETSKMSNNKWFSDLCDDILDYAFLHTGVPNEGDSLKYNVNNYEAKASYYSYSGYTYLTITFTITYYTTVAQEEKLDEHVITFKNKMNVDGKSDYEIIKTIYDYICQNVTYNKGTGNLKYTAYNALVNKSAVCQGYSTLFYRLALEYGIDSRVITGKGKSTSHAWNIVQLDGKYYNVDSTWDAGLSSYKYFLSGTTDFDSHTRNSEFLTTSFKKEYPTMESSYTCSEHKWNDFYTIDKKATYAAAGSKSIHCSLCDAKKEGSVVKLPKLVCKLDAPGSVKGTLTANFGILAGYDDLKVTWTKSAGAHGYYVKYRIKGSTEWKGAYTANRYMYLKDLADGVRYEVTVYPYLKQNGVKYKSTNSTTIISDYTLKKVQITSTKKNLGNSITVKWKGINGETGYQIFRSTAQNGKYVKVGAVKQNEGDSHKIKLTAKKGVNYWYKVRSYKTVGNNKCVYGPWSQKVKVVR